MFNRKHPRKEFNNFVREVKDSYDKLNISFDYINYPKMDENPQETPDHYAVFTYWVTKKISSEQDLNILDVGNTKVGNMVNSISNNVTALVLEKPYENTSSVSWEIHDISEKLKYEDDSFDVFTSPSSLHLIGLGRYGDKKQPTALLNFLDELKRVMRKNSRLYLMLPLGKDQLLYGFHFIYSFKTIKKLFIDWEITDYMTDNFVKFNFPSGKNINEQRFDQETDTQGYRIGQYKIIYIEMSCKQSE